LKRFTFGGTGIQKIEKHIGFNAFLGLQQKFLGPGFNGKKNYKLVSVVSHHGPTPNSGHYTCDVLQETGNSSQWFRCNDTSVVPVAKEIVFKNQNVYLLFYQINDS